jgi:(p)ppGpp synthase/HD superfamily hydrolase
MDAEAENARSEQAAADPADNGPIEHDHSLVQPHPLFAVNAIPEPVLELRDLLNTYLEPDRVAVVLRAFEVGARAHEGQVRKTGEPYIYHPVAVAGILAKLRMDHQSIAAAVLHDTIEDTPLTKEQISRQFGDEIAELVDGVTKLDKMKFRTRYEADAASFRKMLLAMSRDLRVIFIKLADRLHNMRTLGSMSLDARRRIARETLDIYAPIADRLGMNVLKSELEDLGFANLHPWRHRTIAEHVQAVTGDRREVIENIFKALKRKMSEAGVPCRILGREKTPYSIYKKMLSRDLSFSEVMDVYGFRIITHSEPHCYMALGAVHALYQPRPGRFKDYIALPKANGYQSLHTVLNSPHGLPVEIQIRTEEMDVMAEKGAAAHWQYKSGEAPGGSAQVRAREWLMQLVDVQRHAGDSMEFLEGAKSDLFPDEIFVFTPKGKIIDLRRNATALDHRPGGSAGPRVARFRGHGPRQDRHSPVHQEPGTGRHGNPGHAHARDSAQRPRQLRGGGGPGTAGSVPGGKSAGPAGGSVHRPGPGQHPRHRGGRTAGAGNRGRRPPGRHARSHHRGRFRGQRRGVRPLLPPGAR